MTEVDPSLTCPVTLWFNTFSALTSPLDLLSRSVENHNDPAELGIGSEPIRAGPYYAGYGLRHGTRGVSAIRPEVGAISRRQAKSERLRPNLCRTAVNMNVPKGLLTQT